MGCNPNRRIKTLAEGLMDQANQPNGRSGNTEKTGRMGTIRMNIRRVNREVQSQSGSTMKIARNSLLTRVSISVICIWNGPTRTIMSIEMTIIHSVLLPKDVPRTTQPKNL
jgi:hypothetical protein